MTPKTPACACVFEIYIYIYIYGYIETVSKIRVYDDDDMCPHTQKKTKTVTTPPSSHITHTYLEQCLGVRRSLQVVVRVEQRETHRNECGVGITAMLLSAVRVVPVVVSIPCSTQQYLHIERRR